MSDKAYANAGVDLEAGAEAVRLMKSAVEATHGPAVLAGVGAFGGLFDTSAFAGLEHPVLVASTDGVGTKTKVAAAMGQYAGVGHDIVNHCIDDILVQGARPLFFLDYVAANTLDPQMIASVVGGCAAACKASGVALLGGETAEMPGVYAPGEFDLVGTVVGVVDKANIIDGSAITPGDVIIGLPSAGLHTNGFSLARKVFEGADLRAPNKVLGRPLGEALLEPHRCYTQPVFAALDAGIRIKGLAHITGGGIPGNTPRILPDGVCAHIDRSTWEVPALFRMIQDQGGVDPREMFDVFNMGIGLLVFVDAAVGHQTLQLLESHGARRVGEVTERTGDTVDLGW